MKNAPAQAAHPQTPIIVADRFLRSFLFSGPLAIAVSGGSDSTALLCALDHCLKMRPYPVTRIVALTVDHRLRADSRAEAEAVGRLCQRLGVEHRILTWPGKKPASQVQQAAREARYGLLHKEARSIGAIALALAHTADDQNETRIMRHKRQAARSARNIGLAGMDRAVLINARVWALRPFLGLSRAGLRQWLREIDQGWIDDPGNDDRRFERARLRATLAEHPRMSPEMGKDDMDAAAIGHRRLQWSAKLARFAADHLSVAGHGTLFRLDTRRCAEDDDGETLVIETLRVITAIAGGQPFRPGLAICKALGRLVGGSGPARMTCAGALVERRGDSVFVLREHRNLPAGPRELAAECDGDGRWDRHWDGRWDGRYDMTCDHQPDGLMIRLAQQDDIETALATPEFMALPRAIARRALSSEPVIDTALLARQSADGATSFFLFDRDACTRHGLAVTRAMPLFDRFLPRFDLMLANEIAGKLGRRCYPPMPVGEFSEP